jgi:hypothetical protein
MAQHASSPWLVHLEVPPVLHTRYNARSAATTTAHAGSYHQPGAAHIVHHQHVQQEWQQLVGEQVVKAHPTMK